MLTLKYLLVRNLSTLRVSLSIMRTKFHQAADP